MQIKIEEHCANSWKNELKALPEFNECLTSSIIEHSASLARKYLNLRDIHLNELRIGGGLIEFSNLPIDDQLCPPPTSASTLHKGIYFRARSFGCHKGLWFESICLQRRKARCFGP